MSQSDLPDFSNFAVGGNEFAAPDFSSGAIAPTSTAGLSLPIPQKYIDAVKGLEGFTPKAKWDYKQHTNGFGTRARAGEEIDEETANVRLHDELGKAAKIVDDFAPGLPSGVRAALTSLTFNAGDKWTRMGLGAAVRDGDLEEAGRRFNQYVKAGGETLPGLVNRRAKEYQWWFDQDGDGEEDAAPESSALADLLQAPPEKRREILLNEMERVSGADLSAQRTAMAPKESAAALDFSSFAVPAAAPKAESEKSLGLAEELSRALDRGTTSAGQQFYSAKAMNTIAEIKRIQSVEDRIARGDKNFTDERDMGYAALLPAERKQLIERYTQSLDEAVKGVAERSPKIAAQPPSPEIEKALNAKSFGEFWDNFSKSPLRFIATVGTESLPQMVPGLAGATVGGAVGGVPGAMAGMGGGSFISDFTSQIMGGLADEGVDTNDPAAIEKAFKDPEMMAKLKTRAGIHATAVGAFDAVSAGAASKVLLPAKTLAKRPVAREAANVAVQLPVQGALGAGGEVVGSVASGQEVIPGQVGAEFFGEFIGAPLEVAGVRSAARARQGDAAPEGEPQKLLTEQKKLPAPASAAPPSTAAPPQVPRPPAAVAPDDVALLKQQGWTDDDIAEMGDEERAESVRDAREQTGALAPRAPDAPSAEPVSDLTAQIEAMRAGERKGVYLSPDNLANIQSNPDFVARISEALNQSKGAEIVENVDGKGGILVAGSPEIAKRVKTSIKSGADTQAVLGDVTGAGTGKPVDTAAVVQQKTPDGAVVRESAVSAADVAKTEQDFAAPNKTVKTVTPEQAIARRDEAIAAEKAATFTTAKGSTYSVEPDGTTVRNKALRNDPGHEGDQGIKPKSDKTVYLSAEDAKRLAPPDSAKWRVVDHGDGTVSLATQNANGKWGIAPSAKNVPASTMPSVGATPLELWGKESVYGKDAYKTAHFGNDIVSVGPAQQGDGTRASPVAVKSAEDVARAGAVVASEPTEKQAEAGNYQKAHIRFQGLPISIETPKGGTRRGVKDGVTQWEVPDMPAAYGYVRGSTGADGEQIDVFIGDNVESDSVFVVDQIDAETGKFDEHKAVLGANSPTEAAEIYANSFSDGRGMARIGGMSEMSVADFKKWARDGAQQEPVDAEPVGFDAADFSDEATSSSRTKIERLERPDRYDGEPLEPAEIDAIVDSWRYVQDVSRRGRPQSLAAFVIDQGGLQDGAREVRHIAGSAKERPGLVNKNGVDLDDAAMSAWESGFFAGSERPTIAEFLDALQEDLATGAVVRDADQPALEDLRIAEDIAQEIADYGVTTSRFRSEATLREYFGQERPRVAATAESDEEAQAPAKGRAGEAGTDLVEDAPFDLPAKTDGKGFDPYAFSVQVAYAKTGADGLRKKLAGLSAEQLKQIVSAQNLPVSEDVIARGNKKPLVDAIIDAAKSKLANRAAAGGGTVDGIAGKKPKAVDPDDEFDAAMRESIRDKFAEYLRLENEAKSADPRDSVHDDLADAEAALIEDFRIYGLPGDSMSAGAQPINSIADIKRAFNRLSPAARSRWFKGGDSSEQTSIVPEATTKEKIAAESKAKEKRGGSEPMDVGMFGSEKDQTDLVDMAKQPAKSPVIVDGVTGKDSASDALAALSLDDLVDLDKRYKASGYDRSLLPDGIVPMALIEEIATRRLNGDTAVKAQAEDAAPAEPVTGIEAIRDRLLDQGFEGIVEARKFAKENGIEGTNKEIDEAIERAVVSAARATIAEGGKPAEIYKAMVALYDRQPNLGVRTSTSVSNQAYSTPMPLAYLASRLAGVSKADVVYEPTAGNGALLIEAGPGNDDVYANEIDPKRAAALEALGFTVSQDDAAKSGEIEQKADAIVANPPFGAVREGGQSKTWTVDGLTTTAIDHAIALNALHSMTDDGKAVLILGGIKAESVEERRAGYRGQSKRKFFAKLYKTYNVTDHFTVSGDLYKKQGAGWPVDVVVIEGRGQSARTLPAAEPPVIFNSWAELEGKIPDANSAPSNEEAAVGRGRQDDKAAGRKPEPASRDGDRGAAVPERGPERLPARTEDDTVSVRGDNDRGKSADVRKSADNARPDAAKRDRDSGRADKPAAPRREPVVRKEPPKGSGQALYLPTSTATSLDSLVPSNMAGATKTALKRVATKHGDIDAFVQDRLGYDEELSKYYSAEQVDALATAIDNVERGAAFIIGDQTGIGKGRFVAGMIRYALRKGWTPVFVTEKPDLYGDMFRDMTDIGLPKMLGREPRAFMTNTGESVPLDDEALAWKQEADQARADGQSIPKRRGRFLTGGGKASQESAMAAIVSGKGQHDIVFTTYDQMNTIKQQETDRRNFMRRVAPNAMLILDESHNAGGQGEKMFKTKGAPDRAEFVRDLVKNAAGVVYSSATFAKRPDVMDLYARTDMGKAVDDPKMLPALIQRGGVPMQQIVATMLSDAGQYMRRERSFEGVEYSVVPVPVDQKTYGQFSDAVRAVFEFDLAIEATRSEFMEDVLDQMGATQAKDAGVGGASANSIAFASIMHNIVNQMLLSIKADQVATRAIEARKAGEKPVIALASTMESFISDYADDAGIMLNSPIDITFGDVLTKYLDRTLRITIKSAENEKSHVQIPVKSLPTRLQKMFADAKAAIKDGDFSSMPVSPIDWIRFRLGKAGISVAEVTGRKSMIDYGAGKTPKYTLRPKAELGPSGKRSSIAAFNRGDLDALILNRSGSTGVSMHASSKFKDQSLRHMIIAQAEGNIDTHLQMLGRVHRTGQVKTPRYSQIAAEIPAEARPTAVLMKKMASLNANTTGARGSVFMADSIDFMNEYGDKVVANIIMDEPEINDRLGSPLKESDKGIPLNEDAARRVTGRLVLLSPQDQTDLLNRIQDEYKTEIERLDALGENALEAKTVDLQARVLDTTPLKDKTGEGPFLDSAQIEKVSVKAQGRAMAPSEVADAVSEFLGVSKPEGTEQASLATLERQGREWTNKKVGDVRSRAVSWIAEDVAAKSDDARGSTKARHDEQLRRWIATAQAAAPGSRVTLEMGERQMHGIVLSVARTGKAKNPVALGAWVVNVAVPDSVRTIAFPMSKLYPESFAKSADETGATIKPSMVPFTGLISQLNDARREGREERYMVTGNILAGYDQVRGKGQIVNFTMEDGSLRPGILMSRDFALNKFMDTRTVRLRSADQVAEFLEKAPMAEVRTSDKFVTLRLNRGQWTIETAAGRATGGRYYTDGKVRDALKGAEFQRSSGVMRVDLDKAGFKRVVEAIRGLGALFETTEAQDVAQQVVRASMPVEAIPATPAPAVRPEPSRDTSKKIADFGKSVDALKDQLGIKTKKLNLDDDIQYAISGTAVATLRDQVLAMKRGSRVQVISEHAAGFAADADAIIDTATEADIDIDDASVEDLKAFIVALADLGQVIDAKTQQGYALSEEVQGLRDVLSERMSEYDDKLTDLRDEADAIVEIASDRIDEIDAAIEDLTGDVEVVDDDGNDAIGDVADIVADDTPVYTPGEYAPDVSTLDIVSDEIEFALTVMSPLHEQAKMLEAKDLDGLDVEQLNALRSEAERLQWTAVRASSWYNMIGQTASEGIDKVYGLIDAINDEQVVPAAERLEEASGEITTKLDEARERMIDQQEMDAGEIVDLGETEAGPTFVRDRIASWADWLPQAKAALERLRSSTYHTVESQATAIARDEANIAEVSEALERYREGLAKYEAKRSGQPLYAAGSASVSFSDIEDAIYAGETYVLPKVHVAEQLDALRSMMAMLPVNTRAGVLEKIEPEPNDSIDPYNQVVKTYYRLPDGKVSTARFKLLSLRDLRAFARVADGRDGQTGVFFHNIGQTENLNSAVRGQAWHEAFHILRKQGFISGDRWRRLLAHASGLRILDRPLGEFLVAIGQESDERLGDATIRQAYAGLYAGRDNKVEIMRQEAITHMLELWQHGAISDAEMAPVRDILEDIRTGRVSGNTQAADTARADELAYAINAYHGSPHRFDKFSSERIGTGEGAQAYGKGLYFAENERVGKSYRDAALLKVDGKDFDELNHKHVAASAVHDTGSRESAIASIEAQLPNISPAYDGAYRTRLMRALGALKRNEPLPGIEQGGAVYSVTINADKEDMIGWDTQLKKQDPKIAKAVSEILGIDARNYNGREAYNEIGMKLGRDLDAANAALLKKGIVGIHYLDQVSRGAGEGTSNFVIFDDSLIEINAVNGKPVKPEVRAEVLDSRRDGFGLDTSEAARRARAEAMGFDFDTPYYHGTGAIFDAFSREFLGTNFDFGGTENGFFFSDKKSFAESYVKKGGRLIDARLKMRNPLVFDVSESMRREIEKVSQEKGKLAAITHKMALNIVDKYALYEPEFTSIFDMAMKRGHDAVVIDFGKDSRFGRVVIVPNPEQIREAGAAFDPQEEASPQLLAAISGSFDADRVVNWMRWADRLQPTTSKITDGKGKSYTFERHPRNGTITYVVKDGKTEVGSFYVRTGGSVFESVSVMNARVSPDYQRRGVATAAYDAIEADLVPGGLPLYPQASMSLSSDGKAFWEARDPAKLRDMEAAESDRWRMYGQTIRPIIDDKAQAGVKAEISDAVEIVQRIAGQGVRVEFRSAIPTSEILARATDQSKEAQARGMVGQSSGGFYAPKTLHAEALIGLSTDAPGFDLKTSAGHEAWHHVETVLATDAEYRLLSSPSEMSRMRALAAKELGLESDDPVMRAMPDYEVRAYAFQRHRKLREDGVTTPGLHIGIRRLFDRLIQAFRNVQNALRGQGYDSFEAIFERGRTGQLAAREAQRPAPTPSKIEDLVKKAVVDAANANPDVQAHVGAFTRQRLVQADGESITSTEAYEAYSEWADEAGIEPATPPEFDRGMMVDGISTMKIAGRKRFIGVRLAEEGERKAANPDEVFEKDAFAIARDVALGFSFRQSAERQIERLKSVVGEKPEFGRIANLDGMLGSISNDNAVDQEVYDNVLSMFDGDVIGNIIPENRPAPANRTGSVLGRRIRRTLARAGDMSDRARVGLQDKALPIRRLAVERVENETGAKVPLSLDTYVAEALYHGRAGERMNDLQADVIEPLIEILRKADLTTEQLGDYLYARHARERNDAIQLIDPENDMGSGMTNQEADAILAQWRSSAAMNEAAALVDKITEDARKTLLKAGLIDRETFDAWSQKYAHYVPLRGFELGEDENPARIRSGRGFDIRGPESMQALGRRSKADNPVMYAVLQAQQAIVRAEKNRVNKTLYRMIQANPNPAVWKVYRGELRTRLNPTTGFVEQYWVLPPFVRNDSVHGVKINGKQLWMEMRHPALARAMRGVGSEIQGTIIGRTMMTLTRTYAQLLTSYNPEFMVSNFFRDVETAILNSLDIEGGSKGVRAKIVKDAIALKSIRGAFNALRGNAEGDYARYFDEYRLAGGKISFMEFNDVERIKTKINRSLKAGNISRALRAAGNYVEDINSAVENGVRLSTYIALRNNGVEKDRAAFTARELTVNFNRKGEWGPGINAAYLFFNASVQGTTRVFQAFARSSAVKYAVAGVFATGIALELFNYLISGDDDDGENKYDKIPEWVRDRNIIIMNPFGNGDYVMIPMAYGYNLPYLAGQEAMRMFRGKSGPLEGSARIAGATIDAFNPMGTNPLGAAGSFWQFVAPTMLDPGVQVLENKTWYGGPIQPTKYDQRKPDSENYFTSAPGWAVGFARGLNSATGGNPGRAGSIDVSPEVIEHYVEFAGGGVAKFVMNAINSGTRLMKGDEWLPEKAPFVRRLYGKTTTESRKREFFEAWDDVDRAQYEVKQLTKDGDREAAQAARVKYAPELKVFGQMNGAKKTLKDLRAQHDKIAADTALTRDEREAKLNDIREREKALIMRVLKSYRDAQKPAKTE